MINLTLTDNVFISLLKTYENIQHLELSALNEYWSTRLVGQQRY